MDDPWDWDVDRVVQELCTSHGSFRSSSTPLKFSHVDQLEKALREHEVDGEVLMTYDQAELCAELGMRILKHRSIFRNAVRDLQSRSNRHRLYLKRRASEFDDDIENVEDQNPQDVIRGNTASGVESQSPGANGSGNVPDPQVPTSDSTLSYKATGSYEPANKKRKILPTLVTTEIDPDRYRNIATEADILRFTSEPASKLAENSHEELIDDVPDILLAGAYLGSKSISRFDIIDSNPVDSSGPPLDEDKEINFVSTGQLIPGRLIQTHRLVKRRLLRRTGYRRNGFLKSDIVRGSNNPDHDEVLPLYGESDDDMAYDSDTWREIEAERLERAQNQPVVKGLTVDEIKSTFERVLAQIASDWKANKLPKCATKANRIWNEARRSGLKDSIDKARRDLHDFEARIAKWKQTIEKNEYRNVKELELSLSSFEPSVCDREHRSWLIGVLTSPFEPAKVSQPRQPRLTRSRREKMLADDEEDLTSDSDHGLHDFIIDDERDVFTIVDDNLVAGTDGEYRNEDPDITMGSGDDDASREERAQPSTSSEPMGNLNQTEPEGNSVRTPKSKQPVIIDLTTSPEHSGHMKAVKGGKSSPKKLSLRAKEDAARSPLIMGISDLTSAEQKVATELTKSDQSYVNAIFSIVHYYRPEDIWSDIILLALDREWPKAPYNTRPKKDGLTSYNLMRFFETHKDDKCHKLKRYKNLDDEGKQRLRALYNSYPKEWVIFVDFLKRLSDRFEWRRIKLPKKDQDAMAVTTPNAEDERRTENNSLSDDSDAISDNDNNDGDTNASTPDEKKSAKKKMKIKKKRKEVIRDHEAAIAREVDHAGAVEREHRRKLLRERLIAEGNFALGSQQGSIIVNESKNDDQGFIYINDEIARRIKEHQVTGVRFMWDQLLVANKRQGCLLAHTMGLGKTMQVITLLVAISQASTSEDPTVSSQVPEGLRESRTLILCPASLVNNWLDEMLGWLPEGHGLGDIFKIDAVLGADKRRQVIQTWGDRGGVMIIGYNLFKSFIDDEGEIRDTLLEWPNIVIADEAHIMKNPKSKTHVAAANFRTLSRVALTGSPLANNVEEYYSMINWVAPNYLGDIREFRAQYATPIKDGLHVDSSGFDRRNALRMLRVLKSEVAPKVSRITLRALKHDMPVKKEFVITVPLTHVQRQAYEMFIQYHHSKTESHKVPMFALHDLNLICASPSIFLEKLKAAQPVANDETVILPQQLVSDEMALLRGAERTATDDFTLSWKVPILLEIIEQSRKLEDKVLLFSHSVITLDYLEGVLRMKKYSIMRLDGQTQMSDRQSIINRFNKGNIDVFLISTRAGGLGLNITGANRVVIFDAQFNPQNEQQAVGRAYRIGQKKHVFVYRFVCGGTCEQKTLNQAIWKMQLASRVVDKKHPIPKAERLSGLWAMPEDPEQEQLDQHMGKDKIIDELLRQQKFREGIRAIQMMDIFEEEAVEDAELSAEDVALADQMIQQNEARRAGQPIPTQPIAPPVATYSYGPVFPLSSAAPPSVNPMVQAYLPDDQVSPTISTGIQNSSMNRVLASLSSFNGTNGNPALGLPSKEFFNDPNPHLTPIQLPGAEVHIRSSADLANGAVASNVSLPVIREVLARTFSTNANFPDRKTRAQVALEVATALSDHFKQGAPESHSALIQVITNAAQSQRFIEAICIGLIPPRQLVQMAPERISQELETWLALDSSEWQARKQSWASEQTSGDPEHLQTALRRISTAHEQSGGDGPLDQSKSFRLDDREALQAVFERRGLRAQQNKDQEALRTTTEQKKAKEWPSIKEPRLPDWAMNVVRQAQTPVPSSSMPPKVPQSPTLSPRPQPRTPFK
ncbi:hypothetical protein GGS21DRAFT_524910 [Xylaria nigripes]|nr:hypothetical protein GGS21DRAFT_524910 [Xylaria nigripes]